MVPYVPYDDYDDEEEEGDDGGDGGDEEVDGVTVGRIQHPLREAVVASWPRSSSLQ